MNGLKDILIVTNSNIKIKKVTEQKQKIIFRKVMHFRSLIRDISAIKFYQNNSLESFFDNNS